MKSVKIKVQSHSQKLKTWISVGPGNITALPFYSAACAARLLLAMV